MPSINLGRVVIGGLVAGVVFNVYDALTGVFLVGADLEANMTRLGLDPATMQSTAGIVTWVVIDFLMGFLYVWTYAAMRPRFGPGPKTAVFAGLVPFLAISLILFGFTQGGLLTQSLYWKMEPIQLVGVMLGTLAGAAVYKEGAS